jgi:long-chain acyl-CoA synthetase
MSRPWHAHYPPGLPARAEYPAIPLWGFLERCARRRPEAVALVDGETRTTYGDLWRSVLEAAGALRDRGVGPGERVGIRMGNTAGFVVAFHAVLCTGGTVVALSPDIGESEFDAQVREVSPRFVLESLEGLERGDPMEPIVGDLAALQFTSGTTGRPRAAEMTHANLVANALQNARWFAWSPDEVVLAVLPLYHTWGMCVCLNSTFARGGALVLSEAFDPERTFGLIERHGVTVLYGSATMFHRLADHGAGAADRVATLRHVKAGAMLSQGALKTRWDAMFPHAPLQQGYGLTEASPESHDNPPHRHKFGTVGVPIQDTDCRIVDPDDPRRALAGGEAGEVCLRGPQITRGYWNRPDETASTIVDGWLRTGDIGMMDDEGYLTIVDRKKDMLKFRGYTLTPNVIEERLLEHPAVRETVVVGRIDERDGEVPTAFVVLGSEVTDEDLVEHCRQRLARYEVPRRLVRVDAIPRNRVGKPLRRVLRDRINAPDGPGQD